MKSSEPGPDAAASPPRGVGPPSRGRTGDDQEAPEPLPRPVDDQRLARLRLGAALVLGRGDRHTPLERQWAQQVLDLTEALRQARAGRDRGADDPADAAGGPGVGPGSVPGDVPGGGPGGGPARPF